MFQVKTVDDIEFIDGVVPEDRDGPTDFFKNDVVNVLWEDGEMYEAIIQWSVNYYYSYNTVKL